MSETKETVVHSERIFVTAEMARRFLRLNIENNRPLNNERIYQYARDMKAGRWKENGDSIKFADTGEMIDGQHRCTACMQAGTGFWSLVAYGIKREAFITIDRNQVRTTGQVLHLSTGLNDYNAVAGALTWIWRFRDGIMLAQRKPTATETEELLTAHPALRDSVAAARKVVAKFRAGPIAVVAAVHYIFSRQEAALTEVFFEALQTGTSLRMVDPVYRLRERLIQSAGAARRIGAHELIALYFKAWIAEREQRTFHASLRWSIAEAFPNIGPMEGQVVVEKKTTGGPKPGSRRKGAAAGANA